MPEHPYDGPAGGLYDPDPTHRSVPDPLVAEAERELAAAAARLEAARSTAAPGASFYPPPQPHAGPVLPTSPPPAAAPPVGQVSEARAIFGSAVTLRLKSGAKTLRYDFESLLALEEEYGSIAAMQTTLGSLMSEGIRGPVLKRMVALLHLGLLDYFPLGEEGRRQMVKDLELSELATYLAEASTSITRAFGSGGVAAGGGASEQADPPQPSPGAGSTTSPSSPAASPPPPSGA